MNYKFVYDTDFLEKNCLYLSEEEIEVVFATIVGKHNAIFYGYKPERLIEAIKKLTSYYPFVEISNLSTIEDDLHKSKGGILYMKDFDSWSLIDQQFLYSHSVNDVERCCQFITTTIHNPLDTVVPDMINNFDIIYMCKEGNEQQLFKKYLADKLRFVSEYHNSLHSGRYVTSTELELDNYWLRDDAYSYLCERGKENPVIARKVSMVSRSISDCRRHSLTRLDDIYTAERLCGVHRAVDMSALEGLW